MSGRNNSGEERKYLLRPRKREQHDNPDTRREITLSPMRNPTLSDQASVQAWFKAFMFVYELLGYLPVSSTSQYYSSTQYLVVSLGRRHT